MRRSRAASLFGRLVAEPLALVVAVLLVGILLVLTAVIILIWAAIGKSFISTSVVILPVAIIGGAALVPILAITVNAVRNVRRTGGLPAAAVLVPFGDAPRLRRLVAELAAEMNVAPPTHLWLTPHAQASVHESRRLLRTPRRTRHLCVGVPLLAGLTVEQFRAVLCHELSHYLRRHAPFSTVVYRGSAVLRNIRTDFEQATLPTSDVPVIDRLLRVMATIQVHIFRGIAGCYDAITLTVRRFHEYEADRIAARVVGPSVTADALRLAHTVNDSWTGFRTAFTAAHREARARHRGRIPSSPLGQQRLRIQRPSPLDREGTSGMDQLPRRPFYSFAAVLGTPDLPAALSNPGARSRRAIWASHPPLEKRLAALRRLAPVVTTPGDSTPALELLSEATDLLTRVERAGFPDVAMNDVLELGTRGTDIDTSRLHGLAHRWSARLATVLFTAWFLLIICERFFQMFGAASPLTVTDIAFNALSGAIILTALLRPATPHVPAPPRKRRLRRWVNPAAALVITYGAVIHLLAAGEAGVLMSAFIVGVGAPFFNPRKRVPAKWAVPVFSLALGAIQTAPLYQQ